MEGPRPQKAHQKGELEPSWLKLGALAVVAYVAFRLLELMAEVLRHFMAGSG